MEKYSASHTTSRNSSLPHNRREDEHTGKNVDRNGIHEQWYRVEIEDLYEELFSDSIERYNAKQKRNDRKIVGGSQGYLAKVRDEWNNYYHKGIYNKEGKFVRHFNDYEDALKHLNYNKGKNPRSAYYESIVQIGNQKHQPDESICKAILKEYVDTFQERNPNLRLMEVHYHADEATPHIHMDFVPFATGYKQGMDVQNGFDKALMQQMDLERSGTKFKTPSLAWYEQEQKVLADIALSYGIEISSEKVLEPGKKEHESVKAYKERMQAKQELEQDKAVFNKAIETKRVELVNELKQVHQAKEQELNSRESLVEARESILNEKADNLSIREKKLVEAENELSRGISKNKAKEQELDEREQVLDKRENSWNDDLSRLQQAQMRLIQENQAIKQESERLDVIEPNRLDRAVLDFLKNSSAKSGGSFFDYYKKFAEQRFRDRVKTGVQDAVSEYDKSKQPYGGPSKPSTGPTGPSL